MEWFGTLFECFHNNDLLQFICVEKGLANLWSISLYGRLNFLDLIGTKQQYKYEIWIWNKCCSQSLSHSNAFVLHILLVPVLVYFTGSPNCRLKILKIYRRCGKMDKIGCLKTFCFRVSLSQRVQNPQSTFIQRSGLSAGLPGEPYELCKCWSCHGQ